LRIDMLAGLAAGTVVVPQAMAYATIAGLPVEVGLYTCMVPMIAYALLGGARTLRPGPADVLLQPVRPATVPRSSRPARAIR
jgi:MFS superfamily sulfate permease-like transporter